LQGAHQFLLRIARAWEPEPPTSGAAVQAQVATILQEIREGIEQGTIAAWLQPALTHLADLLQRIGPALYHCYDVPGLPRTNNDLEHFYRRLKCTERRITGHKRSDQFVVRAGGFAVYAVLAAEKAEDDLQATFGAVTAEAWQGERQRLHAICQRQLKMHRFHLDRSAYLADLETRWCQLAEAP
jgi:hypothetical protein